eukprot:GHVT01014056.1.p1 GENE.GHVT01014056.1~~GHVT01014056.1.p1  ORF type:complete len:978 (-),score=139.02 GHVT01014056.1:679-3612(-)
MPRTRPATSPQRQPSRVAASRDGKGSAAAWRVAAARAQASAAQRAQAAQGGAPPIVVESQPDASQAGGRAIEQRVLKSVRRRSICAITNLKTDGQRRRPGFSPAGILETSARAGRMSSPGSSGASATKPRSTALEKNSHPTNRQPRGALCRSVSASQEARRLVPSLSPVRGIPLRAHSGRGGGALVVGSFTPAGLSDGTRFPGVSVDRRLSPRAEGQRGRAGGSVAWPMRNLPKGLGAANTMNSFRTHAKNRIQQPTLPSPKTGFAWSTKRQHEMSPGGVLASRCLSHSGCRLTRTARGDHASPGAPALPSPLRSSPSRKAFNPGCANPEDTSCASSAARFVSPCIPPAAGGVSAAAFPVSGSADSPASRSSATSPASRSSATSPAFRASATSPAPSASAVSPSLQHSRQRHATTASASSMDGEASANSMSPRSTCGSGRLSLDLPPTRQQRTSATSTSTDDERDPPPSQLPRAPTAHTRKPFYSLNLSQVDSEDDSETSLDPDKLRMHCTQFLPGATGALHKISKKQLLEYWRDCDRREGDAGIGSVLATAPVEESWVPPRLKRCFSPLKSSIRKKSILRPSPDAEAQDGDEIVASQIGKEPLDFAFSPGSYFAKPRPRRSVSFSPINLTKLYRLGHKEMTMKFEASKESQEAELRNAKEVAEEGIPECDVTDEDWLEENSPQVEADTSENQAHQDSPEDQHSDAVSPGEESAIYNEEHHQLELHNRNPGAHPCDNRHIPSANIADDSTPQTCGSPGNPKTRSKVVNDQQYPNLVEMLMPGASQNFPLRFQGPIPGGASNSVKSVQVAFPQIRVLDDGTSLLGHLDSKRPVNFSIGNAQQSGDDACLNSEMGMNDLYSRDTEHPMRMAEKEQRVSDNAQSDCFDEVNTVDQSAVPAEAGVLMDDNTSSAQPTEFESGSPDLSLSEVTHSACGTYSIPSHMPPSSSSHPSSEYPPLRGKRTRCSSQQPDSGKKFRVQ